MLKKDSRAFKIFLLCTIFVIGLSAIKILPLASGYLQLPRLSPIDPNDGISLLHFPQIFLNGMQGTNNYDVNNNRLTSSMELWHEYTNYIGIIPILLLLIGFIVFIKDREKIIYLILTIIFALLVMGPQSPVNIYSVLHLLPIFSSQRNVTRWIIVLSFLVAIIAGFALTKIENMKVTFNKKSGSLKYLAIILCIFVAIDMYAVNSPVLKQAFTASPPTYEKSPNFVQTSNEFDFAWNFNILKSMESNTGMLQQGVETYCKNDAITQNSIQPAYYITEYNRIPPNANQRPVLFYNNNSIFVAWLIGQELQERLSTPWYLNGNPVSIYALVPDPNNQYPVTTVDGSNAKLVVFSKNIVGIDAIGNGLKMSLKVANSSYKNTFNKEGKITSQYNSTLIYFDGIYVIINETLVDNQQDINVTIYEDNQDITKQLNPDYKGESYLLNNNGNATMTYFSPNKLDISVTASADDTLIINQNYFTGWRAKIDGRNVPVFSSRGLIAINMSSGTHTVEICFIPVGFTTGLCISIISLIALIYIFNNKKLKERIEKIIWQKTK